MTCIIFLRNRRNRENPLCINFIVPRFPLMDFTQCQTACWAHPTERRAPHSLHTQKHPGAETSLQQVQQRWWPKEAGSGFASQNEGTVIQIDSYCFISYTNGWEYQHTPRGFWEVSCQHESGRICLRNGCLIKGGKTNKQPPHILFPHTTEINLHTHVPKHSAYNTLDSFPKQTTVFTML